MRFNFEALLMYTCIIKLPSLRYRNKFLKPQHHNNAPAKKKKKKKKKKMRLANTAVWVSDESKSTPIYIYIYHWQCPWQCSDVSDHTLSTRTLGD